MSDTPAEADNVRVTGLAALLPPVLSLRLGTLHVPITLLALLLLSLVLLALAIAFFLGLRVGPCLLLFFLLPFWERPVANLAFAVAFPPHLGVVAVLLYLLPNRGQEGLGVLWVFAALVEVAAERLHIG